MTTGRAVKGLTSAHAPRRGRALDGSYRGDILRSTRPKVGERLNVRIKSASLRRGGAHGARITAPERRLARRNAGHSGRGHKKSERFRSLLTVLL